MHTIIKKLRKIYTSVFSHIVDISQVVHGIAQRVVPRNDHRRIFLDYASATPWDNENREVFLAYSNEFFNPAALYKEGVHGMQLIQDAKRSIARTVGLQKEDIVITSGGTESINLAIQGVIKAAVLGAVEDRITEPHIVVSSTEHSAVLETVDAIARDLNIPINTTIVYPIVADVDTERFGSIDPEAIAQALQKNTVLVIAMYVNNETGVVNPLREISKKIKEFRRSLNREQHCSFPYFLTDASQAACYFSLNMQDLGVDMLVLDGLKMYGPRNAGILALKKAITLAPIMYGGAHQRGLRPGTESVAHAQSLAHALEQCATTRVYEYDRLHQLRIYAWKKIMHHYENIHSGGSNGNKKVMLNGIDQGIYQSPHILNVCIQGIDAEFVLLQLDARGVCMSAASSCNTLKDTAGSYVIEKMNPSCVNSSLRMSFGRDTTRVDIDHALETLFQTV